MKKLTLLLLLISVFACNNAPSEQAAPAAATTNEAPSPTGVNTKDYVLEDAGNGLSLAQKKMPMVILSSRDLSEMGKRKEHGRSTKEIMTSLNTSLVM